MSIKKQTKTDLIDKIYQNTGLELKDIKIVVDSFLEQLKKALIDNNTIELRGFGTFEIRNRKGRARARNPKTGEIVKVEDHSVVAFRSGKELKQAVWSIKNRSKGESD